MHFSCFVCQQECVYPTDEAAGAALRNNEQRIAALAQASTGDAKKDKAPLAQPTTKNAELNDTETRMLCLRSAAEAPSAGSGPAALVNPATFSGFVMICGGVGVDF